jgi:hypothetical protein
MATVDSDKVVCGGIHAKVVAVLVLNCIVTLPHSHIVTYFKAYATSADPYQPAYPCCLIRIHISLFSRFSVRFLL